MHTMHIDTCRQSQTLLFAVAKKNKENRRNPKNWSLTLLPLPQRPYSLWDWRDSSAVKSTGCPSSGPGLDSWHLHVHSELSVTSVPGIQWPLLGTRHTCGAQAYMQTYIRTYKIIRKIKKNQNRSSGVFIVSVLTVCTYLPSKCEF